MDAYRNQFNISENVDTTDPAAVNAEVKRIFLDRYCEASTAHIERALRAGHRPAARHLSAEARFARDARPRLNATGSANAMLMSSPPATDAMARR